MCSFIIFNSLVNFMSEENSNFIAEGTSLSLPPSPPQGL